MAPSLASSSSSAISSFSIGAVFRLVHHQQVDDPHDVLFTQQAQFVERLALELGIGPESDDENLYRSHYQCVS